MIAVPGSWNARCRSLHTLNLQTFPTDVHQPMASLRGCLCQVWVQCHANTPAANFAVAQRNVSSHVLILQVTERTLQTTDCCKG